MADTFKFVQAQPFSLAGSGALLGATTVVLQAFQDIDGNNLTMTDFGSIGFGTLEPGNGEQEEQIAFTGVTQNVNGTATLTGVSTVDFLYPYTRTSGLAKSHPGGVVFVITNTSGFYDRFASKDDDETITQTWTFTTPNFPQMDSATASPTTGGQLATKYYVDNVAVSGAPDASTTVKGLVQIATDAQLQAGTNVGSTLAILAAAGGSFNVTAAANKVPVANGSNKIDNNWINGAVANGFATLDGSSLVVQNPANATITPTNARIPIASVGTRLADGWQNITLTNATDLTDGGTTVLHSHPKAAGTTSRGTAAGTGTFNIAHGLGVTPNWVRITATANLANSTDVVGYSQGQGIVGSTRCIRMGLAIDTGNNQGTDTNIVNLQCNPGKTTATVVIALSALDATNITLNVTTIDNGGADFTYNIMWEAYF